VKEIDRAFALRIVKKRLLKYKYENNITFRIMLNPDSTDDR